MGRNDRRERVKERDQLEVPERATGLQRAE